MPRETRIARGDGRATRGRGRAETRPLRAAWRTSGGLLVLVLWTAGCALFSSAPAERHVYRRVMLGGEARIVIEARDERDAREAAAAAFDRIAELDAILSDYRVDSEVTKLAEHAGGEARPASEDLLIVLEAAIDLARRTGGAFDPTIGPVSRLWRDAIRGGLVPPLEADLDAARTRVDWRSLEIDTRRKTARLAKPGMMLDLGGIAKGYAADEALEVLRSRGYASALVDLSGDIVAGEAPEGRPGWRIEVESYGVAIFLVNEAVATSGGTYQYLETDAGSGYSHIVDPATGMGLTERGSVTVVARTCMQADGLASAVSVLGHDRGKAIVESVPGARLLPIVRQ